jgi:hypothetical protein
LYVIRGDKYMANAYPPAWPGAAAAMADDRESVRRNHAGGGAAAVQPAGLKPNPDERAAPSPPETEGR